MMLYFRKYFKTCNFKLTCNLCSLVAFAACVQCETIKTDATFVLEGFYNFSYMLFCITDFEQSVAILYKDDKSIHC